MKRQTKLQPARSLAGFAVACAAILVPTFAVRADGALRSDPYAQPARLVRLSDGRGINLVCTGRGTPTVLLESGFGAGAAAWARVQTILASKTRVCGYDRAGYGFSDVGPFPRDGAAVARDIDGALRKAGERGPFIMVGHSAGGLYARLFAARRHDDVAGLVLVDTSVPFQDKRFAAVFGAGAGGLEGVRRRPAACLEAAVNGSKVALEVEGCLPKPAGRPVARAVEIGRWRTQVSELDTLFTSTSEQVVRTIPVLRDVPTIVLTASSSGVAAGSDDPGAMLWQSLHREIAAGAIRGEQRIVKSSHLMMIDRPEVVAAAALDLVAGRRIGPTPRR